MKPKELLENMDPLIPADFFSYRFSIPYVKDLDSCPLKKMGTVPALSNLLDEVAFGSMYLAWSEAGIAGRLIVEKPFEGAFFPDYAKGDCLEIFIDTRDHKKSSFASRFCHHFVFLAGEVNGVQSEEVTRFRSEDTHPLCSSLDLNVLCKVSENSYELSFIIKEAALHGYDPSQFPRIGFAYKINRIKGKPQHYPCSSKRFEMFEHPSLWSSITLN